MKFIQLIVPSLSYAEDTRDFVRQGESSKQQNLIFEYSRNPPPLRTFYESVRFPKKRKSKQETNCNFEDLPLPAINT